MMRKRSGIRPTRARWNIPGSSLRLARSPVAPKRTITWSSGTCAWSSSALALSVVTLTPSRLTDAGAGRGGPTYAGREDDGSRARQTAGSGTTRSPSTAIERRFWRRYLGIGPGGGGEPSTGSSCATSGRCRRSLAGDLAEVEDAEPGPRRDRAGAVADGHLDAAVEWARSRGVDPYVPVTPGLPETRRRRGVASARTASRPAYAWMKFVRDPHPPRFAAPRTSRWSRSRPPTPGPFGMIAATGFGMPAWAARLLRLPARPRGLALLRAPASTASPRPAARC